VAPTFDARGRRIERIVPPGEGLATETGNSGVRTCGCDACTTLYAILTGAELPPAADTAA
jgi:hypothetical protein